MLPEWKQYKKWSLPAKYSFWGMMVGVLSLLWSVTPPFSDDGEYRIIAFNYKGSEITIYGGAGESIQDAVIIRGAPSIEAGVAASEYWVEKRYPGYRVFKSVLYALPPHDVPVSFPRTWLDALVIKNAYGRTRYVLFDVTPFCCSNKKGKSNKIAAALGW